MKCPHCTVEFHDEATMTLVGQDIDSAWGLSLTHVQSVKDLSSPWQKGRLRENLILDIGDSLTRPTRS